MSGERATFANGGGEKRRSFRKRLGLSSSSKKKDNNVDDIIGGRSRGDRDIDRRRAKSSNASKPPKSKLKKKGEGIVRRIRSLSRSRASSRSISSNSENPHDIRRSIVTVTSCRSDGYYNQKAPGSTSKLPRKAPTNLKLFHELAVGIKDAYAAEGKTPTKPVLENEETGERLTEADFQTKSVLWEFLGNIDFVG
jgi:hypothetical protein